MNRETYDLWVGVFVVIGLLSIFYLALSVSGYSPGATRSYYEIHANFDDIGGLKLRSPLKSAGVTVGHVKSIVLDPETYKAKVSFDVRSDFRFPEDSTLTILTAGLLGEQYVGINAGYDDDRLLADGDEIVKTQSAMVLENLIGQLLVNTATRD